MIIETFMQRFEKLLSNRGNSADFTPSLDLKADTQLVTVDDPSPTVSVQWDRAVQQAVINTAVGPTVGSRAYAMVHTAMFDAWAAYDPVAIATQLGDDLQRPEPEITEANKTEAMSFAAYRVLTELFPDQVTIFDELMAELGFHPSDTTTAADVGNLSAEALLEFRRNDGSNQLGDDPNGTLGVPYSDISGYQPINSADERVDIQRWTPERVPIDAEPSEEDQIQQFLTPQWGEVLPFALDSGSQFRPVAPQPFFKEGVEGEVDLETKTIALENGEVYEISKDLIGDIINPEFIEQAETIVEVSANLTDEQKLVAEFWEDPSGTSFPPGTWMTFGEFVSARDDNTLDQDAQLFFALGNAVFDAGIATWEAKRFYDYVRPVRAIRDLGELGLIGELDDEFDDEFDDELEGYTIEAWGGPGEGTQTILATDFLTYQTPGQDPSPPFAEYTSGHSAFSAAGAEILELFTGSDEFGASVTFEPGESRFEPGVTPQDTVTLEWETFSEAADEAGISRIYGGIHFDDGDQNGRILGRQVGAAVYEQAQFFIQGGEPSDETKLEPVFGSPDDDLMEAGVTPGFDGDRDLVLTGTGEDLIDLSTANGENLVYSGKGNDELFASRRDRLFGDMGNDLLDASVGTGYNRLYGGKGNDELLASRRDRLFGGKGDDLLNASVGSGNNRLYGQLGDDTFFLGSGDRLLGGDGDDSFFVTDGGDNLITGGAGADAFWIANGELITTANTITDFELDADVIGVGGISATSIDDLEFSQVGNDAVISFSGFDLATLLNTQASALSSSDAFVFA